MTCYDMLRHVGCCWPKFANGQIFHATFVDVVVVWPGSCNNVAPRHQGSKKPPSGRPGQVDFPFGQVTFSPSLPDGQGPRQAVC